MPRKRVLAEVDGNVQRVPATRKGKPSAKEDKQPPVSDAGAKKRKAVTIKDRKASDKEEAEIVRPASPTVDHSPTCAEAPSTSKSERIPEDAPDDTWICMCESRLHDIRIADLEPSDTTGEVRSTCAQEDACICWLPISGNPEHKWMFTKKGFELGREWTQQALARDQEYYGVYVHSKWTGYGISEVLENGFLAFAKAVKQNTTITGGLIDSMVIWSHIEGMALFLNTGLKGYYAIEHQDNAKRTMLIGSMLLTMLEFLQRVRIFNTEKKDGKPRRADGFGLPNLGLILSLYLQFADDYNGFCRLNEDGWKYRVIEEADRAGIKIQGQDKTDSVVEKLRNDTQHEEPKIEKVSNHRSVNGLVHCLVCYKREELWGLLTVEKFNQITRRSWDYHNFLAELDHYKKFQAVKVGPGLPVYGGKIGGKFYDFNAYRNKTGLMRRYRRAL